MRKLMMLIFILSAVLMLSSAQDVFALSDGSSAEIDAGSMLQTDKNAPGTKLEGPVTILFNIVPGNPEECLLNETVTMTAFSRLRKGQTYYAFSGDILDSETGELANVCYTAVLDQQKLLMDFFKERAMPILSPENPDAKVALKFFDQIAQDDILTFEPPFGAPEDWQPSPSGCCEHWFMIFNATLAIQN